MGKVVLVTVGEDDDDISRPGDKSDATEDRGVVSKSAYPSTPYHEYEDSPWA